MDTNEVLAWRRALRGRAGPDGAAGLARALRALLPRRGWRREVVLLNSSMDCPCFRRWWCGPLEVQCMLYAHNVPPLWIVNLSGRQMGYVDVADCRPVLRLSV